MKKIPFNPIAHVFSSRVEFEFFLCLFDSRAPLTFFASSGVICIRFLGIIFVCFIYNDDDFHYCCDIARNMFDFVFVDDAIVAAKKEFDSYLEFCDEYF